MYIFYSDSGHGWLKVKRSELEELNIADKISFYSYQSGKSVYLEEDCDAGVFINAKRAKGKDIIIKDKYINDPCFIRRLPCYKR